MPATRDLPDGSVAVFVYGTLRPGGQRWRGHLADHVAAVEPACLTGARLHLGPGYPVMVDASPPEAVVGDLVWLSPATVADTIATLDQVEGHTPGAQDNLYERVRRTVTTSIGPVVAWTYVAGPLLDVTGLADIPSGDWFAR